MINSIFTVLTYGFVMLLYSFSTQNKHLISSLIVLEGLMLITIVYLFFSMGFVSFSGLLLLSITFAASEAALGLSLLIEMIRLYSNDKMKTFVL